MRCASFWHQVCKCGEQSRLVDRYFKDFFWTFVLCVSGLSAFLVAQIANAVIGGVIAPAPEALLHDGAKPPPRAKQSATPLADFLNRNIFHAEREDLSPAPAPDPTLAAAAAEQAAGEFNEAECEPSPLSVQVFAVFAAEPKSASVVVLKPSDADEFASYRPGDKIEGATIHEIRWRSIQLNNNGRCELLSLDQEAPKKKPKVKGPKKSSGPASKIGSTVKKTGKNEYAIPRGEIDNVLSNLNQVATQARIVPSFKNGKSVGFKLFAIKRNSLYSKIGIKNGDVVQRINGYELDSPDKALQIYSKLKDASNISVDLVRRGKTMSLSYNIR